MLAGMALLFDFRGRLLLALTVAFGLVCLLVNAVVSHVWPTALLASVFGLLAAFVLSVLAGSVLYRSVESRTARYCRALKARPTAQ